MSMMVQYGLIRAEIVPGMRMVCFRCPVKRCRKTRWCLMTTVEREPVSRNNVWTGDKVYCHDRGHRSAPLMVEESAQVFGDNLEWGAQREAIASS